MYIVYLVTKYCCCTYQVCRYSSSVYLSGRCVSMPYSSRTRGNKQRCFLPRCPSCVRSINSYSSTRIYVFVVFGGCCCPTESRYKYLSPGEPAHVCAPEQSSIS